MTKFGMDKTDILDDRWGKKAAMTTPGPGSYGRWSDFTKDVKWATRLLFIMAWIASTIAIWPLHISKKIQIILT